MHIRDAYDLWSVSYDTDRNLTRDLDGTITRQMLGGLRCDRILEIGCGTGKNTAFLSTICRQVVAVDMSAGMLTQARARLSTGQVAWAMADLTRPWPFTSACADLVVGNLVLEHIADLLSVLREARRVLVPGGKLFLSELHPYRQYQGKKATFRRGDEQVEIAAHVHHVSDYFYAADGAGFALARLGEWWHPEDRGKPPRLLTLLFERRRE